MNDKKSTKKKLISPYRGFKRFFTKEKNIFKWSFNVLLRLLRGNGNIYYARGTHFISGYPGSGKTLLVNKLIQNIDKDKYFCLSNLKEFNGVEKFNISDYFKNNEQIARFPTTDNKDRKLFAIIFDEINLTFNKRLNKRSDYNDIFIGLIEFLVSHRHQGIPRIYFIGQKLELQDNQLQSLFKYQHEIIKKRERYKYWHYYQFSEIVKIPTRLFVVNRVKSIDNEYIEISYLKEKIKPYDLISYNTFGLKDKYDKLPII